MTRRLLITGMFLGIATAASAQAPGATFDGRWDATLSCPAGPDGALPFTFQLTGAVKNAALHAEHGLADHPGWLSLDGPISPNGDASLMASGLTGAQAFNVGQTARGMPYTHPVTAHFDGGHGTGWWMTNRRCEFTFDRAAG